MSDNGKVIIGGSNGCVVLKIWWPMSVNHRMKMWVLCPVFSRPY